MSEDGPSASEQRMSPGKTGPKAGWRTEVATWLGLFVVCLVFQLDSGAWSSDFGGHADEAAHVVTGLMVRDYLAGGFVEEWHPLRYAEAYYDRFPKVAIGHYPPGFYVVEGAAFLLWRDGRAALLLLAALAATVGWQTSQLARSLGWPRWLAILAGLVVCLLPLVRTYTAIVMADLLLVITILAAIRAFARFLETDRKKDALAFGIWAALSILVKGSGLLLALVPPIAIALSGRWRLLKSPRLWLAPVPVMVLALPWMLATRHITAEGMSNLSWSDYVTRALPFYVKGMWSELGHLVLPLLGLGALDLVVRSIRSRKRPEATPSPQEVTGWALVVSLFVFYLAIPSGVDFRYLLPVFPVALLLSGSTTHILLAKLASDRVGWGGAALVLVAVLVLTWRPVEKRYTGTPEIIRLALASERQGASDRWDLLVVSDARGEGAMTAAAALEAPGRIRVLRGSKVLASSDWLGRGYQARFETPDELEGLLRRLSVDRLVIELPGEAPEPVDSRTPAHWSRLQTLVTTGNGLPRFLEPIGKTESARKFNQKAVFALFGVASPSATVSAPPTETAPPPRGAVTADPPP